MVCISWIGEKSVTLVRNQTKIPQTPSLFFSHYTDYAILAPLCEMYYDLSIFFCNFMIKIMMHELCSEECYSVHG
jgi:hypothetical protein